VVSRYCDAFDDLTGARHGGMPTYPWRMAPEHLATRRQLRAQGLCPGGRGQVGQILWNSRRRTKVAYLYDLTHAKPKRTPSTAQLAALGKALAARHRCPQCGTDPGYCLPRSLGTCLPCAGY
jgi:hypothetical protein